MRIPSVSFNIWAITKLVPESHVEEVKKQGTPSCCVTDPMGPPPLTEK